MVKVGQSVGGNAIVFPVDDAQVIRRLQGRIGLYHLNQRLQRESDKGDTFSHRRLDEWLPVGSGVDLGLTLTGLRARGSRNAVSPVLTHHFARSGKLPGTFEGYRILHLTDLHLDGELDVMPMIEKSCADLDYDLCVLTGDFRHRFLDTVELLDQMTRLRSAISGEAVCVLGNHDSIKMVPWMEDIGFRVLLNESMAITRDGEHIALVGVDDYHYFRCADIEKALSGIGAGIGDDFVVMLNHSPEQFRQAAYAGVDLYLCGHTHGGQICLPGGFPPDLNLECTRRVGTGAWHFHHMQGYTSRGLGTSLASVRFNCPPEIVLHELRS